jgi:23S rRNA (uridine2552-2'-O)-methyltransferase
MKRSNSSTKWLQEHFNDFYVKKAQLEGKRSRAIYKLQEIDEKETLFKPGMTIVDLGAAPGSWSEYVAQKLSTNKAANKVASKIYAMDILPMEPINGVVFMQGDFRDDAVLQKLIINIPLKSVDVLLSDMAPNMSGNKEVDIPKAMYLAEITLDFAKDMLKPGGTLLLKMFHGSGFDELVKQIRSNFTKVVIKKPKASRARSNETYLLALGYRL